jgi:drug/metabolite transporter (DMT)-like permease
MKARRWTVIASGLLCGVLALVVLFTTRRAFFSPIAVLVVAAIGFAAVLLQVRFRSREYTAPVRSSASLNLLGIVFAVLALFGRQFHLKFVVIELLALVAIGVFGVSGAVVLHAFRRQRSASKEG